MLYLLIYTMLKYIFGLTIKMQIDKLVDREIRIETHLLPSKYHNEIEKKMTSF